ncbi:hypothetical protein Pcinc_026916 [Petrolisthes cinctipes]|uniref:Uncharacterized protein n=1 Tax=Petrolisthes cinctipes TaxID=88211 RepID=A0AAE1K9C7_PETCI|nr:hypothetical protein Pcinc_026916 [Petrolisthes cinctipes]
MRSNKSPKGNYAQVAGKQPQDQTTTTSVDNVTSTVPVTLFCLYNAHLMNAINPGSFQQQLDYLTSANNLPRMVGPQNPPLTEIISKVFYDIIPRSYPNTTLATSRQQPTTTEEQTQMQQPEHH